jgi:hypothetical protein
MEGVFVFRDGQPPRDAPFTFRTFCKHPRYVHGRPEVWKETRDIDVPWAEIDIRSTIFTLPAADIRRVRDFDALKQAYDCFTQRISTFLSYEMERPHRIVFDVDVSGTTVGEFGERMEYPAIFHVDDVAKIVLDLAEPSLTLFRAVIALAMLSLRVNCFDRATEAALAAVAAALAFAEYYDGFDPFHSGFALPALFEPFWQVERRCSGVFAKTLAVFQSPEYIPMDAPDDMWVEFVRHLCRCGHCNVTKILEIAKPVPLNITVALQGYPVLEPEKDL